MQPSVINQASGQQHKSSPKRDRDSVGCTHHRFKYRINDTLLNRLGNSASQFPICVTLVQIPFTLCSYINTVAKLVLSNICVQNTNGVTLYNKSKQALKSTISIFVIHRPHYINFGAVTSFLHLPSGHSQYSVVDVTGGVASFDLDGQDPCYTGTFYLSAVNGTRLFLIVLENLRDLSRNPFNINCHLTEM